MGFTLFMMGSRVCLIQSKVWGYPWRGRYIETARSSTTALKRIIEGGGRSKAVSSWTYLPLSHRPLLA